MFFQYKYLSEFLAKIKKNCGVCKLSKQ